MPIRAICPKCRKEYSVKDVLAGRKFRCKQCQSPVQVPEPSPAETEPEFVFSDDDEFGAYEDDSFADYELPRVPKSRPQKRKKPVSTKKRRKKNSSSTGNMGIRIGAIVGGVFSFFVVLGIVLRVLNALGGVSGFDLGTSWKPYTTPDGNVTVLLPGDAKTVPARSMAPGGQSFGAAGRNFACAITIEPMVGQLAGMSEDEIFNAFEFGSGMVGAKNVERTTINGKNSIKFEATVPGGVNSENIAFIHKDKVYTMNYAYKGIKGSKASKYFNSMKLN